MWDFSECVIVIVIVIVIAAKPSTGRPPRPHDRGHASGFGPLLVHRPERVQRVAPHSHDCPATAGLTIVPRPKKLEPQGASETSVTRQRYQILPRHQSPGW